MPTIDNGQFRELNGPAPVFPGKTNYWVIVAPRSSVPASRVVSECWDRLDPPFGASNIRAIDEFDAPPRGKLVSHVQPSMKLDGYRWITIQFDVSHDAPESVEWPWDLGTFDTRPWSEPFSGLWAVFQPGQIVNVPSGWDEMTDNLERTGSDVADDLKTVGLPALAFGAGALAFVILRMLTK